MGWLHAGLHPQRAESFCNLKLPHLAQSLHLGEVFLLERKSYESLSFPFVSNPMSSPFPAIRRLVLISRLVFTDGERWRLRLLLLPESRRSGCDTLIADFDAGQKSASKKFHHIGAGKRAYDP
jgi:hypothetical protein